MDSQPIRGRLDSWKPLLLDQSIRPLYAFVPITISHYIFFLICSIIDK